MSQAYGRPFDANAAFGVVYGSNLYAYDQGGQLYNAHKKPVDSQGRLMELDPARVVKKAATEPAAEIENQSDDDDGGMSHQEFIGWYNGKRNDIGLFKIKAEIKKRFGEIVNNKAEARAALEMHIPAEELAAGAA